MAKVNFYYNFKKDAWSWVLIAKNRECWGLDWKAQIGFIPDNLLGKILKKNKKTAESLVYKHLISHPKRKMRQVVVREELKALEKSWRKIENKFFKRLEKITQKPIFTDSFKCYFTSGFMCPYNEKEHWFMVSMWKSLPASITVICHELLHLQTLYYYRNYLKEKGLTDKQIEDFKESLTFLLNESEFKEIILSQDMGYPDHQSLRKKLKKIWQKNRNFQKLLDKGIKIIKKDKKILQK